MLEERNEIVAKCGKHRAVNLVTELNEYFDTTTCRLLFS